MPKTYKFSHHQHFKITFKEKRKKKKRKIVNMIHLKNKKKKKSWTQGCYIVKKNKKI